MNERTKQKMLEQKEKIVDGLSISFPAISLFEDEIAEDELSDYEDSARYHALVLLMGNFVPTESSTKLFQNFSIDYYSEDRDDLDEMTIDIVSIVSSVPTVKFTGTNRQRFQVKDLDRFVDVVTIQFRRMIPIECKI